MGSIDKKSPEPATRGVRLRVASDEPSALPLEYRMRNWAFRLTVAGLVLAVFIAIRVAKAAMWPAGGHAADGWLDQLVVWGAITWSIFLPWAVADVVGWLMYRRHTRPDVDVARSRPVSPMPRRVVFRVVTRGDQPDIVVATVWSILEAMQAQPLFPYEVEVVSDDPVELPDHPGVRGIVIPATYATDHGATHKARALNYALETSPASDDTWLMHLDEESHVTEELIAGIREAVIEEERTGQHRIGQGLVTYERGLGPNPLYTLADSIRAADDLGRFHLQYRMHRMLFGMHGSFILVRNSVEKAVGFDFPPEGCTTEDTTFALLQSEAGTGFRWVRGRVIEQSPASFRDFIRQRRRWFTGMWWGARHAPTRRRYRAPLWGAMFMWSVGWLGFGYAFLRIFSGVAIPLPLAFVGDAIFAVYVSNYLLGLWVSLAGSRVSLARRAGYFAAQVLLLPAFQFIEATAVVYGLVRPERRFHVVAKPVIEDDGTPADRSAA